MDLQCTQIVNEEREESVIDADSQIGFLRIGTTEHPIPRGTTKIGRNRGLCKVVVKDPTVSSVHAEIHADGETAFIADQRSANGTKIRNLQLKPFFYYSINDGDPLSLGMVQATFLRNSESQPGDLIAPETPAPPRRPQHNTTNRNTPLGSVSGCLFNNSSLWQSDDSIVPGTQRKSPRKPTFQQPLAPRDRRRAILSSSSPSTSRKSEPPDNVRRRVELEGVNDTDNDLHEQETQKIELESSRRTGKPTIIEDMIIDDDIYEAETQQLPLAISTENENQKTRENDSKTRKKASEVDLSRDSDLSTPSPPAEVNESMDLVEMTDCPLLKYENAARQAQPPLEVAEPKKVSKNELKTNSVSKTSTNRFEQVPKGSESSEAAVKSHVIADSDDDSTDDSCEIQIAKATSGEKEGGSEKLKIVEEDDETTDDEGKFEQLANLSRSRERQSGSQGPREDEGVDIYEAATQRLEPEACRPSTSRKRRETECEITDIDLLPTQVLQDVATSTPVLQSGRTRDRERLQSRVEDSEDDFDQMPTQVVNSTSKEAVGDSSASIIDDKRASNLDESLVRNLGKILDEEATNKETEDEPTQLMTQHLVDILRPTQSFEGEIPEEEASGGNKSGEGMLGFLDGQAVDAASSKGVAEKTAKEGKGESARTSRESACLDEDDGILDGLPEVRISGTLSNPGSPAPSDYSDCDFVLPKVEKLDESRSKDVLEEKLDVSRNKNLPKEKLDVSRRKNLSKEKLVTSTKSKDLFKVKPETSTKKKDVPEEKLDASTRTKDEKSNVLDSPEVSRTSRVAKRRRIPKKLTTESAEDSDEVFAYSELKKMADKLLASDSVASSSDSKKSAEDEEVDKFSSSGRQLRRPRRLSTTENSKSAIANRGKRTLASSPPPLVSGGRSRKENLGSSSGGTSSGLQRSNNGGQESQEVEEILERKSPVGKNAKVQLTRLEMSLVPGSSRTQLKKNGEGRKKSNVESKNIVEEKSIVDQKNTIAEQKKSIVDQKNTTAEQKKSIVDQKNMIVEQKKSIVDQKNMIAEQKKSAIEASSLESPRASRKRRATISARGSTATSPATPSSAKSRRTIGQGPNSRTTPKDQHRILITGLEDPANYTKIIKKLGGSVVTEPSKATILITDKVRRTFKFLCAIGLGLPVVSVNWLLESNKASRFLDCNLFVLHDPAAESQYKFKLEKSLQVARTKKLLEGYTIVLTPKVNQPDLQGMIEASGGKVLTRAPGVRAWSEKTVIVSRQEDLTAINVLLSKCPKSLKISVQSTEFILTGILRQEVNLKEHKLDLT